MGAEFNFTTLKATGAAGIVAEGFTIIAQAEYDHGHSGYSGSFAEATGVMLRPEEFATEEAAEEWLEENCQKWEEALIVHVIDGPYVMGALCSS